MTTGLYLGEGDLQAAIDEAFGRIYERESREQALLARRIVTVGLEPHRWPEWGDTVVPHEEARRRVGWKGGTYRVRRCCVQQATLGGHCASCNSPIELGDLYAPRVGTLPLCIDCVVPA